MTGPGYGWDPDWQPGDGSKRWVGALICAGSAVLVTVGLGTVARWLFG